MIVRKVISLAHYVKRINKALHEDKHEYNKIPEDQRLIAQELFLFTLSDEGREELDSIVTPNFSQTRISVKTESMISEESIKFADQLKKMAEERFAGTGVQIMLTGTIYLHNLHQSYLLNSQIKCFSLAFLSIVGLLFIIFWSVKYGLLSIFPNLLPVTFIIGIMGLLKIKLNVATVMVTSVAIGIVVDDTVHFITRFRKENDHPNISLMEALRRTTSSVGEAIIFTSVINIMGFLILKTSGFQPAREFGVLIALTLFFALIGDILILPSSIMAVKKTFYRKGRR